MSKSLMQDQKECYITHDLNNLHKHHIYGGPFRKKSEKYGCWCWLRADWHNMSDYGVHNDKLLMLYLRQQCQRKFEEKYSHDLFMKEFKRDWIKVWEYNT